MKPPSLPNALTNLADEMIAANMLDDYILKTTPLSVNPTRGDKPRAALLISEVTRRHVVKFSISAEITAQTAIRTIKL